MDNYKKAMQFLERIQSSKERKVGNSVLFLKENYQANKKFMRDIEWKILQLP